MTQDDLLKAMYMMGYSKNQLCKALEDTRIFPVVFDTLPKVRKFPKRRPKR